MVDSYKKLADQTAIADELLNRGQRPSALRQYYMEQAGLNVPQTKVQDNSAFLPQTAPAPVVDTGDFNFPSPVTPITSAKTPDLETFRKNYFQQKGWKDLGSNPGAHPQPGQSTQDFNQIILQYQEAGNAYKKQYGQGNVLRSGLSQVANLAGMPATSKALNPSQPPIGVSDVLWDVASVIPGLGYISKAGKIVKDVALADKLIQAGWTASGAAATAASGIQTAQNPNPVNIGMTALLGAGTLGGVTSLLPPEAKAKLAQTGKQLVTSEVGSLGREPFAGKVNQAEQNATPYVPPPRIGETTPRIETPPELNLPYNPHTAIQMQSELKKTLGMGEAKLGPMGPPIEPPKVPITGLAQAPKEGFAGNIKLNKYSEDTQDLIKQWADTHPQEIQTARRGTIPDAQVLENSYGIDVAKLQKQWKPGKALNAEELTAWRGTLETKGQELRDITAQIKGGADTSANRLAQEVARKDFESLLTMTPGVTAEAGRALRSFRQEAFNAIRSNDQQKINELLKRIKTTDKNAEAITKALGELDLNDPVAVSNFLRNVNKPKMSDYVTELFYNSILSGPKTHVVNTLSNTVNALTSPFERFGSAAVEALRAPIEGRARERFFGEVTADLFGAVQGLGDGVRSALYTIKTGIRPAAATKWEFRPHAFKGKIGKIINAPSTLLEAADEFMYQINHRAAFDATAYRMAKGNTERMAELVLNPTKELLDESRRISEYRLFRQEAGKFTANLMKLRDTEVLGIPAMRFVVPFLRTPVNLVKYGLERSPLGLLNPKMYRDAIMRNPKASDDIAKAVLGSTVAASIAMYFAQGKITGAAPTNAAERDRFYREGRQPFSVKIGDTWVSYQRMEPFNQVFSQVAGVVDAVKNNDKTVDQKAIAAGNTLAQNLVSQTYLSSISDAINAISDPDRYGGSFLQNLAGTAVPFSAATRTVAQMQDKTIRQPTNVAEQVKANIPGLSQQVPSKLNALGEETKRQTPGWSPINISKEANDALTKELSTLKVNIGFTGDTIKNLKLDSGQQRDLQVQSGQLAKQYMSDLISTPEYQKLAESDKIDAVNSMIDHARTETRNKMAKAMGRNDLITWTPTVSEDKYMKSYTNTPSMEKQKEMGIKNPVDVRLEMRKRNPTLDAMLAFYNQVGSVQTPQALLILKKIAEQEGRDLKDISTFKNLLAKAQK